MRSLRPISVGINDVIFADPQNILNTTRFKNGQYNRTVANSSLPAARFEVITSKQATLAVDGYDKPMSIPTSVRISLSGPLKAKEVLLSQLEDAYHNTRRAIEQDSVLDGFPVSPATEYHVDTAGGA